MEYDSGVKEDDGVRLRRLRRRTEKDAGAHGRGWSTALAPKRRRTEDNAGAEEEEEEEDGGER